jgi:hypothetical protein
MGWFILIVIVLDMLLVALLAIPVGIDIDKSARQPASRLFVYWWFGRLRIPLGSAPRKQDAVTPAAAHEAEPPPPRSRRAARKNHGPAILAFLSTAGLFARLASTLCKLFSAFVIREARLDVRFGLDDPADTGMLFGCASPLTALCAAAAPDRVAVIPEFAGPALDYRARLRAEFIPLRVVTVLLTFLLSSEVCSALLRAWRAR